MRRVNKRVSAWLVFLIITFSSAHVWAEENFSLEQLILQQSFTLNELERSIHNLKMEEIRLTREVALMDRQLKEQEAILEERRKHAGAIARAYYTGERASLFSLLLDAEDFSELLFVSDFLHDVFRLDLERLESYHQAQVQAEELRSGIREKLLKTRTVRSYMEQQLQEVIRLRQAQANLLAFLPDAQIVNRLMTLLLDKWNNQGLPTFHEYFRTLARVIPQIRELATPERISANGLFTRTLSIPEKEFNRFLSSKHDMFKEIRFSFRNQRLIVEGSYRESHLKMVGRYVIKNPQHLMFEIEQLSFEGIPLPRSTIEEMQQMYDLSFYPKLIAPNVQVTGVELANQRLRIQLHFSLFGN